MKHHRTTTRLAAAVGAVALVAGLGACSGGEDEPEARSEESAAPAGSAAVAPADLPEVPELTQVQGSIEDVEVGDCATDAGDQSVTGAVTNSAGRQRDVVVVINWTNDTSDVRGRGVTVLEGVPAGETRDWTVEARVADGATQCVPNVRRGVLAG